MKRKEGTEFIIYLIFYKNECKPVYVGRTCQKLNERLRKHFKHGESVMTMRLDVEKVSKVQCASCFSESDMIVYEDYYINLLKPRLNKKNRADDKLTFSLVDLDFKDHETNLIEKWTKEKQINNEFDEQKEGDFEEWKEGDFEEWMNE